MKDPEISLNSYKFPLFAFDAYSLISNIKESSFLERINFVFKFLINFLFIMISDFVFVFISNLLFNKLLSFIDPLDFIYKFEFIISILFPLNKFLKL